MSSRNGKIGSAANLASTNSHRRQLPIHKANNPIITGSVKVSLLLNRLRRRRNAKIVVASSNAPRKSIRRSFEVLAFSACAESSVFAESRSFGSCHQASISATSANGV